MTILRSIRYEQGKIKREISKLEAQLTALDKAAAALGLGGEVGNGRRKRRLSRAARAKMAAAQRRRWAKVRAAKKGT